MSDSTRDILNQLYAPLDDKVCELVMALTKSHDGYQVNSRFFNGHYHKNDAGQYQKDRYPIPVISIMGLCDIEIDFDGISTTTKLSRDWIVSFDWSAFKTVHFEVYGVENFLNDYGNDRDSSAIKGRALLSDENEFFVSFFLHNDTDGEELLKFLKFLRRNHFYY